MVMNYRALCFMTNELGLPEEAKVWSDKAERMSTLINERLWNGKNGWYSDANSLTHEISDVLSPASFMPLYIGIASEEQAKAMAKKLPKHVLKAKCRPYRLITRNIRSTIGAVRRG